MQSQTLLDHVYTDNQEKYTSGGFTFAASDHHLVYLVKKCKKKEPPKLIEYRSYKNVNDENFGKVLKFDWSFIQN